MRYVVSTACFLGKGATFNFLTFTYGVYGLTHTQTLIHTLYDPLYLLAYYFIVEEY